MRAGHKVEINRPQRGEKREIVEMAVQNAREQLGRRIAENTAQRELLDGVAEVFGLEAPPRRIEVYDNSHIQGTQARGRHDRRGAGRLREGRVPQIQHQIDRAHARRRLRDDARGADAPVRATGEGGRRRSEDQMARPRADRRRAGTALHRLPGVRRSRRRGRGAGRHLQGPGPRCRPRAFLHPRPRTVPPRSEEPGALLPATPARRGAPLRHRHATARSAPKPSAPIPLDEIAGVGAGRKRALLQHFGSAKAVSGASLTDLASVGGVSETLAKKIYDFFHPQG